MAHTSLKGKLSVDQLPMGDGLLGITFHNLDLNEDPTLPFEEGFFSAISILTIVEHLDQSRLVVLFKETRRVVRTVGVVVVTTLATGRTPVKP